MKGTAWAFGFRSLGFVLCVCGLHTQDKSQRNTTLGEQLHDRLRPLYKKAWFVGDFANIFFGNEEALQSEAVQ